MLGRVSIIKIKPNKLSGDGGVRTKIQQLAYVWAAWKGQWHVTKGCPIQTFLECTTRQQLSPGFGTPLIISKACQAEWTQARACKRQCSAASAITMDPLSSHLQAHPFTPAAVDCFEVWLPRLRLEPSQLPKYCRS